MEPPDDQARRERAGSGGVIPPVATRFKPGQSGNPGGHGKGFIPLSRAYAVIAAKFEHSEVEMIARGEKPPGWGKRPLLMPYVKAARMWLGIANVPSSVEIADRTEGKVPSSTALDVSGKVTVEYVTDWRGTESA